MRDRAERVFLMFFAVFIWAMMFIGTVDIENMQAQVNQLQHQVSAQQEHIKLLDAESVKTWRERLEVE